jgi:hypothetical protein
MLLIKHWSPASARFDLGHLNWVGSINSEVAVAAAWHTAPHKTVKDLFDKELIVGGTTGVTALKLHPYRSRHDRHPCSSDAVHRHPWIHRAQSGERGVCAHG